MGEILLSMYRIPQFYADVNKNLTSTAIRPAGDGWSDLMLSHSDMSDWVLDYVLRVFSNGVSDGHSGRGQSSGNQELSEREAKQLTNAQGLGNGSNQ